MDGKMKNVGFIGWRGMVGSVLMSRMKEEQDFNSINPVFFSTSQFGQALPEFNCTLQNAFDIEALKALDIILTCHGSGYTSEIYSNYGKVAGKVIGLTQLQRCVWRMMPYLFSTLLIGISLIKESTKG
jgi:aspartate-semialdehyde dehydrogenase